MEGQRVLEAVEELSSPSHINATKGSSIWLHWNYTYIGDGTHNGTITDFRDQIFVARKDITSQLIVAKLGHHGPLTLVSPIRAPFTGRLATISSNNTIVVHNLQYNDSHYLFLSRIYVYVSGRGSVMFPMRPIVGLTVYGKSILIWLFLHWAC